MVAGSSTRIRVYLWDEHGGLFQKYNSEDLQKDKADCRFENTLLLHYLMGTVMAHNEQSSSHFQDSMALYHNQSDIPLERNKPAMHLI